MSKHPRWRGPWLGLLLIWLAWPTFAEESPEVTTALPAMREVALLGFTRAVAELPLVAETEGRVQSIDFDIGDAITAPGRFARIDTTFLQLDLEETAVQEDRLRSQIDFDTREVARFRALVRQNSAAASQLDALEQSLRDNSHALRALDVKRRVLEERLARATIAAPLGWHVTERLIELGQWVRGGETAARVADFSTLLVPFALTPEQFSALQKTAEGLRLELVDNGTSAPPRVRARIHRVNPGFDPETRKIAVELALADPLPEARGGIRMRLRLPLPEATGAVSLPPAAVGSSYEEAWVVREDARRIPVLRLGPDAGDPSRVRVSSPELRAGDRVRVLAEP